MPRLVTESHTLKQSKWLELIGRAYYRLTGWSMRGQMPDVPKSVIIVGPHTSNWDFFVFMMGSFILRLRGQWMGKHTLFVGPVGWIFRKLGGIPIERSSRHDLVGQAIQAIEKSSAITLVIAAEGTRKKSDHWKSGFYYIALGAKVPIVMAYADFAKKEAGIGPHFIPTGDVEADLKLIRDFYNSVTPKYPEHRSEVRFRDQGIPRQKSSSVPEQG